MRLSVLFLIYLFLEIYITIEVGAYLGGVGTFLEVVLSAMLGVFIIFKLNDFNMKIIRNAMSSKIEPEEALIKIVFKFIGAILLIIPGILSDLIGIFFQLPFLSKIVWNLFKKIVNISVREKKYNQKGEIIDVEIIELKSDK